MSVVIWLLQTSLKQPFAKSTAHNVNHTNWKFWISRKGKYTKKIKDQHGQWKKSSKCNQCDYVSSRTSHLRQHLKIHTRKSQTNATNGAMHSLRKAVWGDIWKRTVEKIKQMQPMRLCFFWGRQFEDTFENAHWRKKINATNATMHLIRQAVWGDIWKIIV